MKVYFEKSLSVFCPYIGSYSLVGGQSFGARAGLDGDIAPSETCLDPAQPHQGFINDCPVF